MKMDVDSPSKSTKDCLKMKNFSNQECNGIDVKTPIQQFYNNRCIFITGGTGFLGKVLIEKLLRSCPDISRIYILVRQKEEKLMRNRMNQLLSDPIFSVLKEINPEFDKKIIGIPGDCRAETLDLSIKNENLIINEVSIVFHVAATVRFNDPLTDAIATNIKGTSSIVALCKNMKNLTAFVHVSTAYANCFSNTVEEKFYDYTVRYEDILQLEKSFAKDEINKSTSKLINYWPNIYTFTKALSEDLIRNETKNLPVGIFRPGIVTSTDKEPIPGWIDNYYGPMGITAGAIRGIPRVLLCDPLKLSNVMPVDLTVNALIASAWDITMRDKRKGDNMLIYNFTSSIDAPLTWGQFLFYVTKFSREYPAKSASWYFLLFLTNNMFTYYLGIFFLHWIPCALHDLYATIVGKKPEFRQTCNKVQKFTEFLHFFTTKDWIFTNDNVQNMWQSLSSEDQKIFNFCMKNFNWHMYFSNYIKGINKFLLKDSSESDEVYKTKSKKLYLNHQLLVLSLLVFGYLFIWKILTFLFS